MKQTIMKKKSEIEINGKRKEIENNEKKGNRQ